MNDQSRFLQNLGSILAWASAEMNVGMFVANLPACRPLLERVISHFSSSLSSSRTRHPTNGPNTRGASQANPASKHYLELDERPGSTTLTNYLKSGSKAGGTTGVETRIYGHLEADSSSESLELKDDRSQKRIVGKQSAEGWNVNVQRDFKMEIYGAGGKRLPITPADAV
jgi:hypothetical protein